MNKKDLGLIIGSSLFACMIYALYTLKKDKKEKQIKLVRSRYRNGSIKHIAMASGSSLDK